MSIVNFLPVGCETDASIEHRRKAQR